MNRGTVWAMRLLAVFAAAVLFVGCDGSASEFIETIEEADYQGGGGSPTAPEYRIDVTVTPNPEDRQFNVSLRLRQPRPLLRELSFRAPEPTYSDFSGDGDISRDGERVIWLPPRRGGTLSWTTTAQRERSNEAYDAYMTDEWAMFRGSDLMPPARTRSIEDAVSKTTLKFDLPKNWTSITEHPGTDNQYEVNNPDRRFDRPTGWMQVGRIGTRTEQIGSRKIRVTGPRDYGIHRMDMLAFLRWTMPETLRLFPAYPDLFTVFIAPAPMWRGGLSAPASIYLHESRPMISENGTSTLLHEMVHVGMSARAVDGADWIVEGMAEYYGLQILRRSGTISRERLDVALGKLAEWGNDAGPLCSSRSSGALTAKAAVLMHRLNREIDRKSDDRYSLDNVLRDLSNTGRRISVDDLATSVSSYIGEESSVLDSADLGDCKS